MNKSLPTLLFFIFSIAFSYTSTAQYCSGNTQLTGCSGSFSDGSGFTEYTDDTYCTWNIKSPGGENILLNFSNISTEGCCDRIYVYDGADDNANQIGNFGGTSSSEMVISSGDELFVVFDTDGSVQYDGWEASYSCTTDEYTNIHFSNYTYINTNNGSIGTFDYTIINFGTETIDTLVVSYVATTDQIVDMSDFVGAKDTILNLLPNLERDIYRTVEFNNAGNPLPAGSYYPAIWLDREDSIAELSETDNIVIEDYDVLNIPYCLSGEILTECSGIITDGSGENDYLSNTYCTWLITVPEGNQIEFNFSELELSPFCCDEIVFYNGADDTELEIAQVTGSNAPGSIISTGNEMFIVFDTDYYDNFGGFEGTYQCTDTNFSNLHFEQYQSSFFSTTTNTLTADLSIVNYGTANASYKVGVLLSEDQTFDQNDALIHLETVADHTAGTVEDLSIDIEMDTVVLNLDGGNYYFGYYIDFNEEVEETSELDNTYGDGDYYAMPYCSGGQVFTTCSGTIEDGSGTEDYGPNSNCSWTIMGQPGVSYIINFTDMDMDTDDQVSIYAGLDETGTLIGSYTGYNEPDQILIPGNNVYIHFESDNFSYYYDGFSLNYTCTSSDITNLRYLESPEPNFEIVGTSLSTNFHVFNNGNTTTPATNAGIFLELDEDLSTASPKLGDLQVPSLAPGESAIISGSFNIADIEGSLAPGNYYPGFIIDSDLTISEFSEADNLYQETDEFYYVSPCQNNNYTGCQGTIEDGSGNNYYASNLDCTYRITVPAGNTITWNFTSFDTESCCDHVRIYDGSNLSSPLLGSYSGYQVPTETIVSSGTSMLIHFETDYSSTGAGWAGNYSCTGTGSNDPNLSFNNANTFLQVNNNDLSFYGEITNTGSQSSGAFQIKSVLSIDDLYNPSDYAVQTMTNNGINAGGTNTLSIQENLDGIVPSNGYYYFISKIDYTNQVSESNEDDNTFVSFQPVLITTGIEEHAGFENVAIFPNPATDVFTVQNRSGKQITFAELRDLSGRLIRNILVSNNEQFSVSLQGLASGVYQIVLLNSEGNKGIQKIVKL